MQYLLSEDEMAAVRRERLDAAKMPTLEELTNFVKHVATTMRPDWLDEPYGCIHENRDESYGYCDRCPARMVCPLPKDFSK